ncbi:TIGR03084 family protein [Mycobacteroides abscessus subsp. abscessus]|nr:TIGR03084 family protein [Mycobacteroides abscessus subsp. abscessus]
MAVTMQSVIADIEAETAALRELIAPLPEGPRGWDAPTPAVGWAIRDQRCARPPTPTVSAATTCR